MEIEHVPVCLRPGGGGAERKLTVGRGLLGKVIIDDEGVAALVAEVLANGATRVGAMNWSGRESDAVADTMIVYSMAPCSSRS